jgi:hypothetical protein
MGSFDRQGQVRLGMQRLVALTGPQKAAKNAPQFTLPS